MRWRYGKAVDTYPRSGRAWRGIATSVIVVAAGCASDPPGQGVTDADVLAFAPDSSLVASAPPAENKIVLRDPRTLVERGALTGENPPGNTAGLVRSLQFSRDGARLLAAGIDGTVIVWNAATSTEVFRQAELKGARQAALSPDGMLVAVAGPGREASVWRIDDPQRVARFTGHFEDVTAIAFSNDGKLIATGSADRTVRLWELAKPEPVTLPEWHRSAVTGLVFSPDDSLLAALAGNLTLWRVAERRSIPLTLGPAPAPQTTAGTQALATLLMIIASARSMQLGGGPLGAPPIGGATMATGVAADLALAFSPDGRFLAVLQFAPASWGKSEVVVAEISGQRVHRFSCECSAIAFRPDGRAIATVGRAGIHLWNPGTGEPLPLSY